MNRKIRLLFALAVLYPVFIHAQEQTRTGTGGDTSTGNLPKTAENFPIAIEAVLHDFPDNFRHITGELVLAQGEIENYVSAIELPGAINCTITHYHSVEDSTASWQARMYEGELFPEASRTYRALYNKLKDCYLRLPDGSLIYLKGEWTAAKEEAPFTTSALHLLTGDQRYKDLKIEIELIYLLSDWVININIVTKKPDDQVGG